MRVWIDQDLCTGDGLCVDHCHDVFVQLEDGIAYVAEGGGALNDPGGQAAWRGSRRDTSAPWCTPPRSAQASASSSSSTSQQSSPSRTHEAAA